MRIERQDCAFWRGGACQCKETCSYSTSDVSTAEAFSLMKRTGGGFASALAEAWFKADKGNQQIIEEAFEALLKDYVERVKIISSR